MLWIIAALGQTLLLLAMNLSIKTAINDQLNPAYAVLFFSALGLLIWSHKKYLKATVLLFNRITIKLRTEITADLFQLSLRNLELLVPEKVQSQLVDTCQRIVLASRFVSTLLMYLLACVFVLFYLLSISTAIFLVAAIGFVSSFVFFFKKGQLKLQLNAIKTGKEHDLLMGLHQLIKDFKGIKLNYLKADRTLTSYAQEAKALQSLSIRHRVSDLRMKSNFEILFFIIMVVCVFLLPYIGLAHENIVILITSILFILPLIFISFVFSSSLEDILTDFNQLGDLYYSIKEKYIHETKAPWRFKPTLEKKLVLKNIYFNYETATGDKTYHFGPVNLTIKKGETLFIIGGNGSGKSTLLKLLTGLYQFNRGEILWDDKLVSEHSLSTYKELFSVIFTDFHLFAKLYGLKEINEEHIEHLLHLMELDQVTQLQKDRFSSLWLSTGQKKRMAMLHAFLDNKEIYILDEVAADQDPEYRKFFYHTVLPELKKAGKTILVVSHDDHYFHVADRIIQMKEGKAYNYKLPISD